MEREIISLNAEVTPQLYGLPDMVQDVVRDVAAKRMVPVEFTLAPVLAAVSVAVGSKAIVRFNGYENRLNLWSLIIAPSGKNKSQPSKDIFTPLEQIDNDLYVEYVRCVKAAEKNAKDGQLPEPVPKKLIILQDSTPEARVQALYDNPHGVRSCPAGW